VVTSVFDETCSELILATRRIFFYVTGKKNACGIRASSKHEVLTFKTHPRHKNTFDKKKKLNLRKANREEVNKVRKDIRFLRSKANEQKKIAIEYKKIKDEKNFIKHARIYKRILEKIDKMTKIT